MVSLRDATPQRMSRHHSSFRQCDTAPVDEPTSRERRLALNEATFRTTNDRLDAARPAPIPGSRRAYFCECSAIGCTARVHLSFGEYEMVRSSPRHFLVVPGHEVTDVETVIESHRRYAVVEKKAEVARVVERTDPRRSG